MDHLVRKFCQQSDLFLAIVCRVVTLGKVVVPDIKEANEGLSFTAYILTNFDAKLFLPVVNVGKSIYQNILSRLSM